MNPAYAKVVVFLAAGALGFIRAGHSYGRRSGRIATRRGGFVEIFALTVAVSGFIVPIVWASTSWFAFADTALHPLALAAGALVQAFSLWMFHRTHSDLGANWSARLELLETHQLVTTGVYARIRHPMYLSLLLYGFGQALVAPNEIARGSCLVGTALLFALRVGPEERMMRERFGAEYEAYAARAGRIVPRLRWRDRRV